jgi:hypothetical protein
MKIEFLAFYKPGVHLLLCGGDDGCGALIGDAEAHAKWHQRILSTENLTDAMERKVKSRRIVGTW